MKKHLLRIAIALCVLVVVTGCSARESFPQGISLTIRHPRGDDGKKRGFRPNEPVGMHVYAWKPDRDAPGLDVRYAFKQEGMSYQHPLEFNIEGPDGLVYLRRKKINRQELFAEYKRWNTKERWVRFDLNLSEWMPAGFRWRQGRYRVKGRATAGGKHVGISRAWLNFGVRPGARTRPPEQLLIARLAANKKKFKPGESIVLRGACQITACASSNGCRRRYPRLFLNRQKSADRLVDPVGKFPEREAAGVGDDRTPAVWQE